MHGPSDCLWIEKTAFCFPSFYDSGGDKEMKRLRLVLAFGCLLLCVWFLMPIGLGVFHIGMVYPVLLLLLAAAILLNWQRLHPLPVRHRFFTRLAAAVLCVGLLLILIPVGFMGADR